MSEKHSIDGLGSVHLRDDGILHTVFDIPGEPSMELAAAYLEARRSLVGDAVVPVLIEIVTIPYADRDVRTFFMQGLARASCRAVVTPEPSHITLFKTFQQLDPYATPTEFFFRVDDAIEWIRDQMPTDEA